MTWKEKIPVKYKYSSWVTILSYIPPLPNRKRQTGSKNDNKMVIESKYDAECSKVLSLNNIHISTRLQWGWTRTETECENLQNFCLYLYENRLEGCCREEGGSPVHLLLSDVDRALSLSLSFSLSNTHTHTHTHTHTLTPVTQHFADAAEQQPVCCSI